MNATSLEKNAMREHLLELLKTDPFSPFKVVLTSGKEYEIGNPQLVAVGETEMTIYVPKSDRWAMLRMNQVASLEAAQAA
jgi:hypothetical protein